MRAKDYATALVQLLNEHPSEKHDQLIESFIKTVSQNGHRSLFPKILRYVDSHIQEEKRGSTIIIRSAVEITEKEIAGVLRSEPFVRVLSGNEKIVERQVDPSLIGGIVVQTRERTVDQSQKRILQELYSQLTV